MTKTTAPQSPTRVPWNRGRIIGPKPPLKPKHIWAIRTRLQHDGHIRDLAMFNVAIDSKLRGCDLVKLRVSDVHLGEGVRLGTTIVQQKTGRPVPFEMTEPTRDAVTVWLKKRGSRSSDWLFPSRTHAGDHITTRQYGRLVDDWVTLAGLDPANYGTHSLRRTKVAAIRSRESMLAASPPGWLKLHRAGEDPSLGDRDSRPHCPGAAWTRLADDERQSARAVAVTTRGLARSRDGRDQRSRRMQPVLR